jgi:hypothetical protein
MAFNSNGRTDQQSNIFQRGPEIRAVIAVELGTSWGLPPRLVGELIGASRGYVTSAAKCSIAERAAIYVGEKRLSTIHNATRTNRVIDKMIRRYGPETVLERAWNALDQLTAPSTAAE